MSLDDDIQIIASTQLFSALGDDQLRLLAFGAERLKYAANRHVFYEGDRAEFGLIVATGEVGLTRRFGEEDQIVKTVTQGGILGEFAMITETKRMTSAIALSDCELIRINRSLVRRMLSEYPEIAASIHGDVKARLTDFLQKITDLEQRFDIKDDV